jgi:hypothetical protein
LLSCANVSEVGDYVARIVNETVQFLPKRAGGSGPPIGNAGNAAAAAAAHAADELGASSSTASQAATSGSCQPPITLRTLDALSLQLPVGFQKHIPKVELEKFKQEDVKTFEEIYSFMEPEGPDSGVGDLGSASLLEAAINAPFIKLAQSRVEACVWQFYLNCCYDNGAAADLSLNLASKKPVPFIGLMDPELKLFYAGSVSQLPSNKECFKLTVSPVFGVDFYLHGSGHADYHSDCCVPAWGCKVVGRADQANVELQSEKVDMYVDKFGHVVLEPPDGTGYFKFLLDLPYLAPSGTCWIKGGDFVFC